MLLAHMQGFNGTRRESLARWSSCHSSSRGNKRKDLVNSTQHRLVPTEGQCKHRTLGAHNTSDDRTTGFRQFDRHLGPSGGPPAAAVTQAATRDVKDGCAHFRTTSRTQHRLRAIAGDPLAGDSNALP
jgi:hypothetical protein